MPDKRCPMCGKPNPEEAETCKYCQARLKPLIKPATPGSNDPTRRRPPLTGRNASDLNSSLPDWLKDLRIPQGDSASGAAPAEDQPGLTPEDSPGLEGESGEADWLSRIQPGGEQKPESGKEPQQGLPDWLANLGTSEGPSTQSEFSSEEMTGGEPSGGPEENEPDWLRRIRARQKGESPQEEELPAEDEGLPGSSVPESPLAPAQLPDWLSNLGKQETPPSEVPSEEPDWSFLGAAKEPTPEKEQVPDWFSHLDEDKSEAFFSEEEEIPVEGEAIGEPVSADNEAEETEVSVADADQVDTGEPGQKTESTPSASTTLPRPDEGLPGWLARLETSGEDKDQTGNVPAFVEAENTQLALPEPEEAAPSIEMPDLNTVPDWISQMPTEEAAAEETTSNAFSSGGAKPGEADNLMPAELPSWLEAMRPVEAETPHLSPEEAKGRVEKVGPLSGLRGALPAEPGAVALQKPKVSSVKLQITENQQAHMALMEELLKTEIEGKPVTQRPTVSTQYVMRILVGLILLFAVLAPLWLNKNMTPMPESAFTSPEIVDASRLINGVTPGGIVLLAFDYEPGLSGELDVSAQAVIEHLMTRDAYLTIVSTNVSGPLLAERMFNAIAAKKGTLYTSVANLGYVPGGASALLSLAENPRQVLPYDLHALKVWDSGPLARIKTAADFSLVVVFTEKADTARGWVEQVQPTLRKNNTPLVMVVSAQAEPMVRPYYETSPKQVGGMLSGLASFAAYESITGQTGLARTYWDAYGAGMLAAAGLFLLGGLMYGGMAVFTPRKRAEGEGAE